MTGAFFGLPPFRPFACAAAVFAGDVTWPPFRPSATACGFLAMRGHLRLKASNQRHEVGVLGHGEPIVQRVGARLREFDGAGLFGETHTGRAERVVGGESSNAVDHVERINPSDWDVNNKVRAVWA